MATSFFRNKNRVRPRKRPGLRRKRFKVQQRRLVGLGVPEEMVAKMSQTEVRKLLRHPAKVHATLGLSSDA